MFHKVFNTNSRTKIYSHLKLNQTLILGKLRISFSILTQIFFSELLFLILKEIPREFSFSISILNWLTLAEVCNTYGYSEPPKEALLSYITMIFLGWTEATVTDHVFRFACSMVHTFLLWAAESTDEKFLGLSPA